MENNDCKHIWILKKAIYEENRVRYPEHCQMCDGVRELIYPRKRNVNNFIPYYTPIVYEVDDIDEVDEADGEIVGNTNTEEGNTDVVELNTNLNKYRSRLERKEYFDKNREAIERDHRILGLSETGRKWGISPGTLHGVLKRWGKEAEGEKNKQNVDDIAPKLGPSPSSPPSQSATAPSLTMAQYTQHYRELDDRLDEIKADVDAGLKHKDIMEKYGFSKDAWNTFRRRHGLPIGETGSNQHRQKGIDAIRPLTTSMPLEAVEYMLTQCPTLESQRHFFEGYKYGLGYRNGTNPMLLTKMETTEMEPK